MNAELKFSEPPATLKAYKAADWRTRLYFAPTGAQTHAIIAAVLGEEPRTDQLYVGKACITSDGFVMCDYIDAEGLLRAGAFVGSFESLQTNVVGLIKHLQAEGVLSDDERDEVLKAWVGWFAKDYRSVS